MMKTLNISSVADTVFPRALRATTRGGLTASTWSGTSAHALVVMILDRVHAFRRAFARSNAPRHHTSTPPICSVLCHRLIQAHDPLAVRAHLVD